MSPLSLFEISELRKGDPIVVDASLGKVLGYFSEIDRGRGRVCYTMPGRGPRYSAAFADVYACERVYATREEILNALIPRLTNASDNTLACLAGDVLGGVCGLDKGKFTFDPDPQQHVDGFRDLKVVK